MINTTFHDISEVATKQYQKEAKEELEDKLKYFLKESSVDIIKQLGLQYVFMLFSSCVAKSNNHENIGINDVNEAFTFLKYILSRDSVENILVKNGINLGLPQAEQPRNRLADLMQIKGDVRTKNNLDSKITRLKEFLSDQRLSAKYLDKIEKEIRATILFLSRLFCISRLNPTPIVPSSDIDIAYDFVRYLMLKLTPLKLKVLNILYIIDDEKIWRKIPKMFFDQTTHDHLSNTAYSQWENELPENFETLKKHINCSARPFIAAILGYSELYGAKHQISRVSSEELVDILDDFEKRIFGNTSPMIMEDRGLIFTFTEEGLEVLGNISNWITDLIVNKLGKDEFVFNFSSTVPRQISLLFFISIFETIKSKERKIDLIHILTALSKWANILQSL
ncbi:MAG: hypothetical protein JXA54_08860 [Candidatus Heimdallarchaeota archaeon]|nr:hypothetical protein [Candidatus Heimdallarchaeota archaeon]